jgi:ATP-dependent DNA helicase DinG
MPSSSFTIADVLGPDGVLSHCLEGFEFRPSQLEMATLIEDSLRMKRPAIIEAGTGTGKTFGYLVPLILSRKKAVISTGTKNLQEQILLKDLPLLQEKTGLRAEAVVMKGRRNYLCLHRYHQYFSQASLMKTGLEATRQRLEAWLERTEFADRSELPWLSDEDALWDALSSTGDQCLGGTCVFLDECFLNQLRRKAAKSFIVIVNHHLFFADLKVKRIGFGEIIPRFQVAVFDEAHHIEDIATEYFGETLSTRQLEELADDLQKDATKLKKEEKTRLNTHVLALRAATERLRMLFEGPETKGRIEQEVLSELTEGPGHELERALKGVQEIRGTSELDDLTLDSRVTRAAGLVALLEDTLRSRGEDWLNWYEKRKKTLFLHASPLDISVRMNERLMEKVETVVFTSATLSTNHNFDYIRSRLGLPADTLQGIYPSHFDFLAQTLMYIPPDLPPPKDPEFGPKAAERIAEILERTKGRALVLFTSYHNLNLVYGLLDGRLPYSVYRQGDAPRSLLLDEFRDDVHSVLLATGSFWQGVDVPGESLSCLIVDKLPFDSPGEPLVAARIDAIRLRGGNPFMEYQVPSAIISLKQGLGRLIRKSSDRGILSVLDTRILTSRYGRLFLESLPKMTITHDLNDIRRFFEEGALKEPRYEMEPADL